ncbi:MAG: hypothetical protein L0Z62_43565 [Gemmataceae bacterium]|nr:hypothetical protein [Gemmataceae bacterium]
MHRIPIVAGLLGVVAGLYLTFAAPPGSLPQGFGVPLFQVSALLAGIGLVGSDIVAAIRQSKG